MNKITVIDYGIGNIKSIMNALEKVGATTMLSNKKDDILESNGIILPGVGAFSHGMEQLRRYGLVDVIKEYVATNKPLLGICLGMQMLFSESNEFSFTEGLGVVPGSVERLKLLDANQKKLPHISWNDLNEPLSGSWNNTILSGIKSEENMYFIHSFVVIPNDSDDILSTTRYSGYEFCSSIKRGNVYGCQFHPEKSAVEGLKIIKNFVEISKVSNNG